METGIIWKHNAISHGYKSWFIPHITTLRGNLYALVSGCYKTDGLAEEYTEDLNLK